MSERIAYFDILRAIAIVGVVAIHASGTGLSFDVASINFNFTVLWRNLLNFAVPLFLAISGFFLVRKQFKYTGEYFAFLKKQIPRVYIPTLIWSLGWFTIAIVVYNKPVLDELFKVVTFQSSGPYYFIALIIQFYLLLPVLGRLANRNGLLLSVFISIGITLGIFYVRYFTRMEMPLIFYAGNFLSWLMFFVLGMYLGSSSIKFPNPILLVLIITFYVLSCIESYALIAAFHQPAEAATAVKPSSFLYSFFLIIFLFRNQNWIRSTVLKRLGDRSFAIYLIHLFALQAVVMLTSRLYPQFQQMTALYQLFLVIVVIVSCSLYISISNQLLSFRQARLLGFR